MQNSETRKISHSKRAYKHILSEKSCHLLLMLGSVIKRGKYDMKSISINTSTNTLHHEASKISRETYSLSKQRPMEYSKRLFPNILKYDKS